MGMRGITGIVSETSLLDENEGIRFRGYSIPDCCDLLPTASNGEEPLPEGMLWLLMTGEIPTAAEVAQLSGELAERAANIPQYVFDIIDAYPKEMHPMSQLSSAVLVLQTESKFAANYREGVHKSTYWKYFLEDSLDLIARVPHVAARIFRNVFRDRDQSCSAGDPSLDWSANFARMLGWQDPKFDELMRLYLTIHADHEGGNVSAHATRLVASALSDPYLSFSAGMNGLAGPLHGLANQEVLRWTKKMYDELDGNVTAEAIEKYCWDTLNGGNVIPGFGHAVLKKTDPRYMAQRAFALKHMKGDPLVEVVATCYDVVPRVLTEQGKANNPWPNVDAHSGVLLCHYGLSEEDFYTVLFGVSRAIGVCANITMERICMLPLERPKSITSEAIAKRFAEDKSK